MVPHTRSGGVPRTRTLRGRAGVSHRTGTSRRRPWERLKDVCGEHPDSFAWSLRLLGHEPGFEEAGDGGRAKGGGPIRQAIRAVRRGGFDEPAGLFGGRRPRGTMAGEGDVRVKAGRAYPLAL